MLSFPLLLVLLDLLSILDDGRVDFSLCHRLDPNGLYQFEK